MQVYKSIVQYQHPKQAQLSSGLAGVVLDVQNTYIVFIY